jgi:siderophore synthetase component
VVLEAHLQNVLVAVDEDGFPQHAVFRDHEGVKLLREHHAGLLDASAASAGASGPGPGPGVDEEQGWQRLVYCLLTNHLLEIGAAVAESIPAAAEGIWPLAGAFFSKFQAHARVRELLVSSWIPAKTNLVLRWNDADGASSQYVGLANPLRRST